MDKKYLKRRLNYFLRVRDIMNIYKEKKDLGLSNKEIHKRHIFPLYKIEQATFYIYFNLNYEREIKEIQEQLTQIQIKQSLQTSIFGDSLA